MGSWTSSNPCKSCGKKGTAMIKCTNCATLGCTYCVGGPGRGMCKVCKKNVDRVRV
jgi:hypothetical protein